MDDVIRRDLWGDAKKSLAANCQTECESMPLRFMGVETEYALTAVDREGKALDREVVARRLPGPRQTEAPPPSGCERIRDVSVERIAVLCGLRPPSRTGDAGVHDTV